MMNKIFALFLAVEAQFALVEAYSQDNTADAWKNHFDAFGEQNLSKIMLDYTQESVLEAYEHTEGTLTTAVGLTEIETFFTDLFAMLSDTSTLSAPVVDVTDDPYDKQVFLVWACPSSNVQSATDTFFFNGWYKIARQNIHWTKGSKTFAYTDAKQEDEPAAKNLVTMDANYAQATVDLAWANHFSAFGGQDVTKIMQDYTEKSVVKAFDHSTGVMTTAKGLAQIQNFFEGLFTTLSDTSGLRAPVDHGADYNLRQVFLVWECPTSGIISATDTFMFDANNTITRQNIAFASAAAQPEPTCGDIKTAYKDSECCGNPTHPFNMHSDHHRRLSEPADLEARINKALVQAKANGGTAGAKALAKKISAVVDKLVSAV